MGEQGQGPREFVDRGVPLPYTPGFTILVWGQGNVRVDVPAGWQLSYADNITELRDRPEPDTAGMVQITVLPPFPVDEYPGLPLRTLFRDMTTRSASKVLSRGPIQESRERHLQMIWQEKRYVDAEANRIARATTYLARGGRRHVVVTCTCWDEGLAEYGPLFETVRRSIRISDLGDALTGHRQRALDN